MSLPAQFVRSFFVQGSLEMRQQIPLNNLIDERAAAVSPAVILRQNQIFTNQIIMGLIGVQLLTIVKRIGHDLKQPQMIAPPAGSGIVKSGKVSVRG